MPTTCAQCGSSKPPTFWGTVEKSTCGLLPFWGVKVTAASIQKKWPKRKSRGSESYGETWVTRPSSFQDLKEAYKTYGRPRVTRRPRRPKRPRLPRPRVTRPTGPTGRPSSFQNLGGSRDLRDLGLRDLGLQNTYGET